jgi:hypothetical protein
MNDFVGKPINRSLLREVLDKWVLSEVVDVA